MLGGFMEILVYVLYFHGLTKGVKMSKLNDAADKRDKAQEELEKIIKLAKEMHRLAGKTAYEELEFDAKLIKGVE